MGKGTAAMAKKWKDDEERGTRERECGGECVKGREEGNVWRGMSERECGGEYLKGNEEGKCGGECKKRGRGDGSHGEREEGRELWGRE